jgi:hypothetical protein
VNFAEPAKKIGPIALVKGGKSKRILLGHRCMLRQESYAVPKRGPVRGERGGREGAPLWEVRESFEMWHKASAESRPEFKQLAAA